MDHKIVIVGHEQSNMVYGIIHDCLFRLDVHALVLCVLHTIHVY